MGYMHGYEKVCEKYDCEVIRIGENGECIESKEQIQMNGMLLIWRKIFGILLMIRWDG